MADAYHACRAARARPEPGCGCGILPPPRRHRSPEPAACDARRVDRSSVAATSRATTRVPVCGGASRHGGRCPPVARRANARHDKRDRQDQPGLASRLQPTQEPQGARPYPKPAQWGARAASRTYPFRIAMRWPAADCASATSLRLKNVRISCQSSRLLAPQALSASEKTKSPLGDQRRHQFGTQVLGQVILLDIRELLTVIAPQVRAIAPAAGNRFRRRRTSPPSRRTPAAVEQVDTFSLLGACKQSITASGR